MKREITSDVVDQRRGDNTMDKRRRTNIDIQNTSQKTQKSLEISRSNQNPYIEEEQTTQWQKKMYKRTNNDQQNIHIKIKDRVTRNKPLTSENG